MSPLPIKPWAVQQQARLALVASALTVPRGLARAVLALLLLTTLTALPVPAAVLVDDRGRVVDVSQPVRRVVTLAPALTETLCALGACARLVGTDRYSNWPAAVQALPKLGGLDDAQVERIVALRPDLVLAATSTRAVDRLESLGLRVLALEPRSLADTQRVIARVASALDDDAAGARLWQQLQARIDRAAARVPAQWRGRTVYFEVATTPFAASPASFIGELLDRLGLVNIVPAGMGPFPQLGPEFVVRAQPDLVMAAAAALAQMPQRPGWARLQALQRGARCGFAPLPYDALMRAGPRLAEAAEALADCLVDLNITKVQP